MAIFILPGLIILLALATLAGLGTDSRDPDVSLFREPPEGPSVTRHRVRLRY